MKKLIPYITFTCLTAFAASSGLPVIAGGCSNHLNKKSESICAKDDTECKTIKAEKSDLKEFIES